MIPTLIQGTGIQNLSYSTHVESTAITANDWNHTGNVRLVATSDCFFLVSAAGTAATTTNGTFLPAGIIEYIRVPDQSIISVVQSTSAGKLNITPMSDVTLSTL